MRTRWSEFVFSTSENQSLHAFHGFRFSINYYNNFSASWILPFAFDLLRSDCELIFLFTPLRVGRALHAVLVVKDKKNELKNKSGAPALVV